MSCVCMIAIVDIISKYQHIEASCTVVLGSFCCSCFPTSLSDLILIKSFVLPGKFRSFVRLNTIFKYVKLLSVGKQLQSVYSLFNVNVYSHFEIIVSSLFGEPVFTSMLIVRNRSSVLLPIVFKVKLVNLMLSLRSIRIQ